MELCFLIDWRHYDERGNVMGSSQTNFRGKIQDLQKLLITDNSGEPRSVKEGPFIIPVLIRTL